MDPWGEGPGDITEDGCAVEVYTRLPSAGEPELLHSRVPTGATILDLGCGTGRLAEPLSDLGHPVTGVDNSQAMLAHLGRAEPVLASIEDLHLGRRFDAVLMASHLINHPNLSTRTQLLSVAAAHLTHDGQLLLEWHQPNWFDRWVAGETYRGTIGKVATEFTVNDRQGDLLTATITYVIDGHRWSQHFTTRRLTVESLGQTLRTVGLVLQECFGPDNAWVEARTLSRR